MTLVGTDGELIASPMNGLLELLLAPAERLEVVVDFQTTVGTVELVSLPYERGWMGSDKRAAATLSVMQFKLEGGVRAAGP